MAKKRQSTSPASSGYRPRKKIIAEDQPEVKEQETLVGKEYNEDHVFSEKK